MKKLLSVLVIAGSVAVSAIAQNAQVQVGTTRTYSVTPVTGSDVTTYTWTLSGGASGFVASGTSSQSVTWDVISNNNVLSITPGSSHSCVGTAQTITVDVVAALSRTISWGVPAVGICSGDNFASTVSITGAVPATSWSFNYTVDADPTVYNSGALTLAATSNVTLASFTNASNTADASHTIHIVSFTVDGQSFTPASSVDKAFTVYMVPAVGTIQ